MYPETTARRLRAVYVFLPALLLGLSTTALAASAGPECKCRTQDGQMSPLGTVACVSITGSDRLVRCVMSTNTPYWQRLNDREGCPGA